LPLSSARRLVRILGSVVQSLNWSLKRREPVGPQEIAQANGQQVDKPGRAAEIRARQRRKV